MKKSWRIVVCLAAMGIVFSLAAQALAQQGPITGGYAETSINDPEVISAASYAVSAQGRKQGARISLVSIRSAEVQVVAGLNYRLGLRVKVNGKAQDVTAVVYKNLKRKYSLTKWEAAINPNPSATRNSTIEQLVKSLAEAYTKRELGSLDAQRPYFGKVKIVIENSLADDNAPDRFETKRFRTLAQAERWLRSKESSEGLPARQDMPLLQCKRGVCSYNFDGGILHNHLYLQKISYGYRNGRPIIKTIYLLDGD